MSGSVLDRLRAYWGSAPMPAIIFGVGGLIPFVGLTLLIVAGPPERHDVFVSSLANYGAVIVTFVGALHWGYAVRTESGAGWPWAQYGLSVVPGLVAWASLALPASACLRVQAGTLVVCFVIDRILFSVAPVPGWFVGLRALLTVVAACMLLLASYFS